MGYLKAFIEKRKAKAPEFAENESGYGVGCLGTGTFFSRAAYLRAYKQTCLITQHIHHALAKMLPHDLPVVVAIDEPAGMLEKTGDGINPVAVYGHYEPKLLIGIVGDFMTFHGNTIAQAMNKIMDVKVGEVAISLGHKRHDLFV